MQNAADMLEEAAVNDTHTPYLYAQFLRALLQARKDHTTGSKSATGSRAASRAVSPENMDEDEDANAGDGAAQQHMNADGGVGGHGHDGAMQLRSMPTIPTSRAPQDKQRVTAPMSIGLHRSLVLLRAWTISGAPFSPPIYRHFYARHFRSSRR